MSLLIMADVICFMFLSCMYARYTVYVIKLDWCICVHSGSMGIND